MNSRTVAGAARKVWLFLAALEPVTIYSTAGAAGMFQLFLAV